MNLDDTLCSVPIFDLQIWNNLFSLDYRQVKLCMSLAVQYQ